MNNIPTAEERYEKYFNSFPRYGVYLPENCKKEIIEIANKLANDKTKLYVQAALEAASENACTKYEEWPYQTEIPVIDRDSILSAYPLSKIK